jgi:[ribosomal protein S5]-alanine N-acetyltransferase
MPERPTLYTVRLILRPHLMSDVDAVQAIINDKDVVSPLSVVVPYPYTRENAVEWISKRPEYYEKTGSPQFAIVQKDGRFTGGIGLVLKKEDESAEIGYWIGKQYWGQGYCTEAASAVVKYGFEVLGLHRIHAYHMTRNPASGRVMQKIGMQHEGYLRQAMKKWGVFEDIEVYAILKSDYFSNK